MHSMSITPECYSGAFSRKSTFLKIPLLFIFSLPSPILPTEEREKTERTPTQLPALQKCCLLIFAIAMSCLVLAAIPARNPRLSLSIIPKIFGISLCPPPVMLLPVVWQITSSLSSHLVPRLLLCSCGSVRKILPASNL